MTSVHSPVRLIESKVVVGLLNDLLGARVTTRGAETLELHPATCRGLVNNDDRLVGMIGSDLDFAHRSGAALAMIPAQVVLDHGRHLDEELLEYYLEVANVLSRVVNESAAHRLRIDPGMDHSPEDLGRILHTGDVRLFTVSIEGYGEGTFGFWTTI